MQTTAKHLIFIGRVQGVGFRFTAHRIANRHFLTGFVRNLPDGTVEMLAQGQSKDINDCIAEINQATHGYITETRITDLPAAPRHTEFRITF
ncbi:MAG TPA: acylphosphatase [Sedimentisphaerales bacterium]|nr:acylphosphatase [Sedimentisphaerales bacterium]